MIIALYKSTCTIPYHTNHLNPENNGGIRNVPLFAYKNATVCFGRWTREIRRCARVCRGVVYVGYSIDHRADGRWPLGDFAAAAAAAARAAPPVCHRSSFNQLRVTPRTTLCPKKVSPLNILQQPLQTCTDLNEILHTQDDIYFCHRRQIS